MKSNILQQVFQFWQMRQKEFAPRRIIQRLMIIVVMASILPTVDSSAVVAQSVDPACLSDRGIPVVPLDGDGAWAVILNFNHPLSTTETIACWAIIDYQGKIKRVVYTPGIRCQIINNINNVEVGNGRAPFDGNFQVVCPRRADNQAADKKYETFYVHAKANFPDVEASYTILSHQDVQLTAQLAHNRDTGKWFATLSSRYGSTIFEDKEEVDMLPNHRVGLQSTILNGEGTHHINRDIIETRRPVAPFSFDFTNRIHIGGPGASWTLYNMVIDPPPPDSGFN